MGAPGNSANAESFVTEIISLDENSLAEAARFLARQDPDLARIVKKLGTAAVVAPRTRFPHARVLDSRAASFAGLRQSRLRTTHRRHRNTASSRKLSPTRCPRAQAQSILKKQLDLDAVHRMTDSAARTELIRIKGIGPWTADVYLLMALRRPDAWPVGDLALQKAVRRVKRLRKHPSPAKLEHIGKSWRPWRAVAARLLWHDYLSQAKKST